MTDESALPVLDWVPRHDPESRDYPIRAVIGDSVPRGRVMHQVGPTLNQGQEGACVGHGWANEATAAPVPIAFDVLDLGNDDLGNPWPKDPQGFAFALYFWCRRHDEWEGEAYDGTSVLSGAKGMKMLGLLPEYRWAFGIEDVIDALMVHGPVVLGINWYTSMYGAPGGELKVSGTLAGGHCILAVGYDPAHQWSDGTQGAAVALYNSWGPGWGQGGIAWISVPDLARLLKEHGEACVPMVRANPVPQPEPEPVPEPAVVIEPTEPTPVEDVRDLVRLIRRLIRLLENALDRIT